MSNALDPKLVGKMQPTTDSLLLKIITKPYGHITRFTPEGRKVPMNTSDNNIFMPLL